tara:strand:+ start:210 stop:509 length:300 start_codon:yes stop_codon:yes gene_type:complete
MDANERNKLIVARIFEAAQFSGFKSNTLESPRGQEEPGNGLSTIVQFEYVTKIFIWTKGWPDMIGNNGIGIDCFGTIKKYLVDVKKCLFRHAGEDFKVW